MESNGGGRHSDTDRESLQRNIEDLKGSQVMNSLGRNVGTREDGQKHICGEICECWLLLDRSPKPAGPTVKPRNHRNTAGRFPESVKGEDLLGALFSKCTCVHFACCFSLFRNKNEAVL